MKAEKIKEGIYWVGGIDWNLRNFHGYLTQKGSTYNAYLIVDEKITLVDTVKEYMAEEMIERISSIIDPSKIDMIICNHVEMDHSGALPKIVGEIFEKNDGTKKGFITGRRTRQTRRFRRFRRLMNFIRVKRNSND